VPCTCTAQHSFTPDQWGRRLHFERALELVKEKETAAVAARTSAEANLISERVEDEKLALLVRTTATRTLALLAEKKHRM